MHGLLTPETAGVYCGPGLKEVCETVGIPPVLHLGSCVDNSRILLAATEVVKAGGPWKDLSDIPAVGAAPEWMSEKAIAIGQYFVTSGVYVIFGGSMPITVVIVVMKTFQPVVPGSVSSPYMIRRRASRWASLARRSMISCISPSPL